MSNFRTYYHPDFSIGLYDAASDAEIPRGAASYIRNWDISYKGQLRSRKGLTRVGDALTGTTIASIGSFSRTTGASDLLISESTNLRYLDTTWKTLDSGFTAEALWIENCPLKNKVYVSSKNNQQHSWDRASTTLNSCLTDLGAAVPHGNVLKWWQNHMFTINEVVVSGTTYGNDLYISNFGDPDTWTLTDKIPLPGVGGRGVTFGEVGSSMIVFKERSTMFLSGYGIDSWKITSSASNIENPDEAVGTLSPRGGCKVGDEWWFIDDQGYIRRIYQTDFDAFRKNIISTHIPDILGTINPAQLQKAVAQSNGDKVYFAIPTGSGTTNNLVLVFDLRAYRRTGQEAWTVYEGTGWTPSGMITYLESGSVNLYLADAASGGVYKHTGNSDLGAAINCRWDGKLDGYDRGDRYKKFAFGDITAPAQGDLDALIYSSVDGSPYALHKTFNLAGSGSTLGPTGSFLLGPTGDNRLGGSETLASRWYFEDGGGTITGFSNKVSLRCAETDAVILNTYTTNYKLREVK